MTIENDDEAIVAAIDAQFQQAVKENDVDTMDRILADGFVLVTGRGRVFTKADLLHEARNGTMVYERQDDSHQVVRIWGDTAIITALLHAKGMNAGEPFDYQLWFSDVYLRTSNGWQYVFGQSSLPLEKT